jgi:hypothetical protein
MQMCPPGTTGRAPPIGQGTLDRDPWFDHKLDTMW